VKIIEKKFKCLPSVECLPDIFEYRVFHSTPFENLQGIEEKNGVFLEVEPIVHGIGSYAESYYFRERGCVPCFDYRQFKDIDEDDRIDLERSLWKCTPIEKLTKDQAIAILFLRDSACEKLLTWIDVCSDWLSNKRDKLPDDRSTQFKIAPYIESGYPDFLSISDIEKVWKVTLAATD